MPTMAIIYSYVRCLDCCRDALVCSLHDVYTSVSAGAGRLQVKLHNPSHILLTHRYGTSVRIMA
ncbi:hypothetical protein SAMN04488004_11680 [Loktanella salsilacus]|uniref:Uncharacterized protein n=1 Tax=Loktanella salsilacus TaxID=195913 RepID=A0A1I4HAV5_9RHOB|nr:hypothetical protein SAMN04488004_11680 [Loktanella salsilacus]